MTQKTTYYDLLGIAPEADLEAISAAYLRATREQGSGGEADALRQKLLKQAFEVLSDPARRSAYDAGLAGQDNLVFRTAAPCRSRSAWAVRGAIRCASCSPSSPR